MPTQFTTISVPRDLGSLIRRIAREEDRTVVELISSWTKTAAAKLGWDQDFSPLQCIIEWDGAEFIVRATFFGEGHRDFTVAQARSLANSIMSLAANGGAAETVKTTGKIDSARIDLDASGRFGFAVVMRKGAGVILRLNAFECSMNTNVAQAVATKLREAADLAAAEALKNERIPDPQMNDAYSASTNRTKPHRKTHGAPKRRDRSMA